MHGGGDLVVKSCPILGYPMDCSLPGCSVHGIFQARMGCHCLLRGIFLIQGLNLGLLHCRLILYQLSYQGNPIYIIAIFWKRKPRDEMTCQDYTTSK